MSDKIKVMLLQTRHIESISYLTGELVKSFPIDRYEVTLVYLEAGAPTEQDNLAQQCIFLGLDKRDYKGLRWRAMKTMRAFLQTHHFDVIIANMYKPVSLLMQVRSAITASLCIGIIHTFGEFDRWGRRFMMRLLLDKRWRMVGVSGALKDYLISARCGLNAQNTITINNAVDSRAISAAAMSKEQARAKLHLPSQGIVFGTLGRCVKGKRHLELLKAFHQFVGKRTQVYLVIIGDGELQAELVDYVNKHNLQAQVYLVGYVPQAVSYLRALDIFVFPSESEGFGMALVEAMSLSLPCIVNDIEPLVSIVAGCGTVVDSSTSASIAKALEHYYQMPEAERLEKGAMHCARVQDVYDIDHYRCAYRQLVEDCLNR